MCGGGYRVVSPVGRRDSGVSVIGHLVYLRSKFLAVHKDVHPLPEELVSARLVLSSLVPLVSGRSSGNVTETTS
jgi:hypothetical protein